jgi:chromosome segregation ATPase
MGPLMGGVRRRVAEMRYLSRLVLGALVFLTLIGAFWSAAQFGVAATLILGLVNLAVRRAQDRSIAQVEEFLAQRAELPSSLLGGEPALPAYLEALLKQTAENLSEIQRMMIRGEEERRATQAALTSLTETLAAVSDQLKAQQKVVLTLSKNHYDLQPAMADLATQVAGAVAGSEEIRTHLRNLDVAAARLVEEVSAARTQAPEAMRQEIKVLAQTLARGKGANGDRPHF